MDCRSASAAERVCDCDEGVQCPNERKPIFFMEGNLLLSGLVYDRRGAVLSPGREHVANYSPFMRSRLCWAKAVDSHSWQDQWLNRAHKLALARALPHSPI